MAIETMEYKEQSLFWISSDLMYGALGMHNKIPPNANIVARITVTKIFDKFNCEMKPQPDLFTMTLREVNRLYVEGKVEFSAKRVSAAILIYNRVVRLLDNLRLANATQEVEVKEILIKIHQNLAICYNKVNDPQKSCLAMRELERLTSISGNAKALFHKGKSLLMLNDLNNAEKYLRKALNLQPDNYRIKNCLEEIETMRMEQKNYRKKVNEYSQDPKIAKYLKTLSISDYGHGKIKKNEGWAKSSNGSDWDENLMPNHKPQSNNNGHRSQASSCNGYRAQASGSSSTENKPMKLSHEKPQSEKSDVSADTQANVPYTNKSHPRMRLTLGPVPVFTRIE